MRHFREIISAIAASLLLCNPATAQSTYPNSPIKLVVGFPPGGPTDTVGRLIAQALARELKESVVVENRGGAGGVVAAGQVARAKADGYTLMLAVESGLTRGVALNPGIANYDPVKDFTPIGKFAKQRVLMVVNPSVPAQNLGEFLAYVRSQRPGTLNFAGTVGSSSHVGGVLFDRFNGTEMTLVNYQGGSQPINDLIAGVVQVGFLAESAVGPHVQSGKLRAMGVASDTRSPAFPNLVTIKEGGAKPMDISPWFGLVGPAGLQPHVTSRLVAALAKVVVDRDFGEKIELLATTPIVGSSPSNFSAELREELIFWKKYVNETGMLTKK